MADECDRADQEIESGIQDGIWRARQLLINQKQQPVSEYCYCGDVQGVRFCGEECREELEFDRNRGRVR